MRRVVVTGVGLVSPCGGSLRALGEAIVQARSAGGRITSFEAELFPTRIAAEVPETEKAVCLRDERAERFADVSDWKSAFGIVAARRAIAASHLEGSRAAAERRVVVLGTGLSSVVREELEGDLLPFVADGRLDLARYGSSLASRKSRVSPARHLTDAVNRELCRMASASGASLSHFGACAASTQAIGDAFRRIREDRADLAICGGMDSMIHPFGLISFMLLGALSTRNEEPGAACKPFHRDRDGFLIGEGAAMLVLEEREAAEARKAPLLAEVVGYGSSCDGYNLTAPRPDGAGAAAAMEAALRDARLQSSRIGWVNAHGTGTGLNDPAEAKAVKSVFGERAAEVPISSLKPVFGHCIAAAGAMEVAATLAAFEADRIPPTPNLSLEGVDPDAAGLDHVMGAARQASPELVMTNNYGFGGQNASLILRRLG